MIFVIIALCIGIILLIERLAIKYEGCGFEDFVAPFLQLVFGFVAFCFAIYALYALSQVVHVRTIPQVVEMYKEENTEIEQQLAETVQNYMEYEQNIITEVSPESAITLVTLYPDLKSDTLVATQMQTYIDNSNKIKELKEEYINSNTYRWWLYFGGSVAN